MKMLNERKPGFSLAEVLVTLAIIGVVAALTIPIVVERSRQSEYRAAGKKIYSTLNNVVQQVAMQENMAPEDYHKRSVADNEAYLQHIKDRLRIIKVTADKAGNEVFYTSDGYRYHVINTYTYYVDANGDKNPTRIDDDKSDWRQGKYEKQSDLLAQKWYDVELTDMFYVFFDPDNGRSTIAPYVQGIENIVKPGTLAE